MNDMSVTQNCHCRCLEEELERLTDEINEQMEPSAFLLARRGALCRKVCLEFFFMF